MGHPPASLRSSTAPETHDIPGMDLPGVLLSIDGLLAASIEISDILSLQLDDTDLERRPSNAFHALAEIITSSRVLASLRDHIQNSELIPSNHRNLLLDGQLDAALTDGIVIFAQLEVTLLPWQSTGVPVDRWAEREAPLAPFLARLRGFRTRIVLIAHALEV